MYNRKVTYNNFIITIVHNKFSLVPCQPDDGSLYTSRNMLQQNFSTYKNCYDRRSQHFFLKSVSSLIVPEPQYTEVFSMKFIPLFSACVRLCCSAALFPKVKARGQHQGLGTCHLWSVRHVVGDEFAPDHCYGHEVRVWEIFILVYG